jgi:flagellin
LGTQAVGGGVANHGTVSLSSSSADGIVIGGNAVANAGFASAGAVAATNSSSVSSIASMNVLTADNATKALAAIDGALTTVNSSRAALGAIQNRFTSVVTSLQTTAENLTSSRSRIQDADFALETANLSRAQILQQAGTAMVAQANQLPQSVLSLLK